MVERDDYFRGRNDEVVIVFFFQAEDGIRDYKVTGVQTCALPICAAKCLLAWRREKSARRFRDRSCQPILPSHLSCESAGLSPRLSSWLSFQPRDRKSVV